MLCCISENIRPAAVSKNAHMLRFLWSHALIGTAFFREPLIKEPAMFVLHERLAADTLLLGNFPLCSLLLMNDCQYPWFILVPRRAEVSELFQLDSADQLALWKETTALAELLKDIFAADKMNIASLGNMVPQLHMHVIARRKVDAAWPAAVWGRHPALPYSATEVAALRERLHLVMPENFTFAGAEK
jgi:diadenosine tetraphosphate (Ap4A) HIT family hydrolase